MDKFAALDLGTNTFHLLVVSFDENGHLIEHFRLRKYIHLAKEGIQKIGEESYKRAIDCIKEFTEHLASFELKGVSCSGTAALRTASNGPTLVREIEEISGIEVNVIDGLTEARYIFEGVSLAIPELKEGNHLIIDIGGGSVEFIVIKNGHFVWSDSFPIGIAILNQKFHHSDPISSEEIQMIDQFIQDHLIKLMYLAGGLKFDALVGASGSFEVLSHMVKNNLDHRFGQVSIHAFGEIYQKVMGMNIEERKAYETIPNERVQLIVVALQLIHYVLSQFDFQRILVSKYAMKEGMLARLHKEKKVKD